MSAKKKNDAITNIVKNDVSWSSAIERINAKLSKLRESIIAICEDLDELQSCIDANQSVGKELGADTSQLESLRDVAELLESIADKHERDGCSDIFV